MNKLFIVTGSNRGLGKEIVNLLLENKQFVVSINRNTEKFHKKNLVEITSDFRFLNTDFIKEIKGQIRTENFTEIIFINNAGVIEPIRQMKEQLDFEEIQNHVNVNYLYPIKLINEILRVKGDGILKIINISTGAAKRPIAGWAVYCSSKAAISMYLRTLELENNDVLLEEVDPGVMDTGMQDIIRQSNESDFPLIESFRGYKEKKVLKSPKDVAYQVLKEHIF